MIASAAHRPTWPTLVPCILPVHIPDALEAGVGTYASSPVGVRVFAPGEKVYIGNFCSLGCDVQVMTGGGHDTRRVSTFHFHARKGTDDFAREPDYQAPRPTIIGNDVWIGDGAVIGGGSTVGHGAVIGAYSVIMNKEIPPYAVVVGNPARVIRYRFNERVIASLLRIEWWKWSEDQILAELPSFYGAVEDFCVKHDPSFTRHDPADDIPENVPIAGDTIDFESRTMRFTVPNSPTRSL